MAVAKLNVDLQPWVTPNFVILEMPPAQRQDGFKEGPKLSLAEVDTDTLALQCDAFRAEVFRSAGKVDPAFVKTTEWQPIETAPKEGQFVALFPDGMCDMMGGWDEYQEILGYGEAPATHWLRLPPRP